MTLAVFYADIFVPKVLPMFRKNTRIRYEALWRQRESALRGFARSIEIEKRKAKGPVGFVRTLLREAAQLGLIASAPRLPPGIVKDAKKLPAAPTLAEVEDLVAKASGWIRIALALGVYAGLRSGEIRALRVGDVNLDAGIIRVVRTLSADEEEEPKGDKQRIVPVVGPLAEILRIATARKGKDERVVVTSRGTTPCRQHVLSRLVELQVRLGARHTWSVHALRHAFCSHLVRVGIGVEAVRALAGHSSIRVTNRYVHATGVDLQEAMERGFRRAIGD